MEGWHRQQQTDSAAAGKRLQDDPSNRQLEKGRGGLGAQQ